MAYQLKRLNVVKIVDSESERDALIDKGFKLVKEQKGAAPSGEPNPGTDGKGDGQ